MDETFHLPITPVCSFMIYWRKHFSAELEAACAEAYVVSCSLAFFWTCPQDVTSGHNSLFLVVSRINSCVTLACLTVGTHIPFYVPSKCSWLRIIIVGHMRLSRFKCPLCLCSSLCCTRQRGRGGAEQLSGQG